jgi:uncharacterized protein YxeA
MYKIILILVPVITIVLFIDIYRKIIKNDNNKIIKNLEEYAKKEKTKQQKSEILGQKPVKRTKRKKEGTRMHHL